MSDHDYGKEYEKTLNGMSVETLAKYMVRYIDVTVKRLEDLTSTVSEIKLMHSILVKKLEVKK